MSLWIPPSARGDESHFRKAPAPKVGPSYGHWAGRDLSYLQLPGGSVMQFDLSRLTLSDYREMRSHYQVNMSLAILTFMMHQMDWQIQCTDKNIANTVDEILRDTWTDLIRGASQAYWAGFSPCVLEYDNEPVTGRVIISKVKDLVPEETRVNWKPVQGAPGPDGMVPPVLYEYDGIRQFSPGIFRGFYGDFPADWTAGGAQEIPAEYTFWYPLLMENGHFYGRKLLQASFVPWFFSTLIHLFSNRYFERFGEPTPIGRYPEGSEVQSADGRTISGQDAIFEILENLRSRGVVALPNDSTDMGGGKREYDYDITYLESQMRGADFERYLIRLDEEISLGIYTPISVTRVGENASHNTVQVQLQVYLWMLNAMAADIKTYIDRHIVKRIHDYNFGPNAPKARWVPRIFGKDNAETLRAMIAAGMTANTIKPDLEQFGTALGIDLQEVKQLTAPIAKPTDPNAAPADPRVNRQRLPKPPMPKAGNSGVIRPKIAARVAGQVERAFRDGDTDLTLDMGFRRQMEDAVGDPEAVAGFYERMDTWARDAFPVCDSADEFNAMFKRVLESELA